MTETAKKRKSLPKNKVAGVHFPIPLNGKALEVGLLYSFPKVIKVMSHPINKNPKVQNERKFTKGRLKEISSDGYYFAGPAENCCPNEQHIFHITKRKIKHFHAKVTPPAE